MSTVVQRVFPFVVALVWFGMTFVLLLRFRSLQLRYLHLFAAPLGAGLDAYLGGGWFGGTRAIWKAMLQRQDRPDVEQLRRRMWRRYRLAVAWILGFPLCVLGLMALVISQGWIAAR